MRFLVLLLVTFVAAAATSAGKNAIDDNKVVDPQYPSNLSAFRFFEGSSTKPSSQLIPYRLRTPLFSDYAEKERFIYVPVGSEITANAQGKLSFPVGSALIKSFGYKSRTGGVNVIETRVLLHRPTGWVALPYVWRADGSDADLRLGGTRIPVEFNRAGTKMSISYAVPNKNQCKQCHSSDQQLVPIGTTWQNMELPRAGDRARFISSMPQLASMAPWASWDDSSTGTIAERANSYLNVNCGHCHAPLGSASNSGLFFDGSAKDATAYGIGKRPVAAGRASGNFNFVVEAGSPEKSILVHRMKSTESAIAMPELGRSLLHYEGIALLEQWIANMPPSIQ